MTVKELMQELKKYDENLEVRAYYFSYYDDYQVDSVHKYNNSLCEYVYLTLDDD